MSIVPYKTCGSTKDARGGMIATAFGDLMPVRGALLQEAIGLAVILNALCALRIAPGQAMVESTEKMAQ